MRFNSSSSPKYIIFCIVMCTASASFAQNGLFQKLCRVVLGGSSNSSNVDPTSINGLSQYWQTHSMRENPNRVVAKNDERFLNSIWRYIVEGRGYGSIETSREAYTTQYTSILVDSFGIEPRVLRNGRSYISQRGLTFVPGFNRYYGEPKLLIEGLHVTVTPEKAFLEFQNSTTGETAIQALAKAVPENQGLLKRFLGSAKKKKRPIYVTRDAIFNQVMNGGDDKFIYHHSIEVPRDELTAFMIELDQVALTKPK